MKLTISLPSFKIDHSVQDNTYDKLVAAVNEYLNADITWEWADSNDYYSRLPLKYASGDVADVIVAEMNAVFYSAATGGSFEAPMFDENGDPVMQDVLDENGEPVKDEEGNVKQEQVKETQTVTESIFWDLTDYIDDYDNLATIPRYMRADTSYQGRMYALPRSRTVARNGLGYRQDWMNKLGLKEPTTWVEFKEMLRAFTFDDPDGNGLDDTVGLAVDQWPGMWDQMMTWFGVPNVWGVDENGDLIHKSQTKEYMMALDAFRELFDEGLVNDGSQKGVPAWNDESLTPGKARTVLCHTEKAGVMIQTLDECRKWDEYLEKIYLGEEEVFLEEEDMFVMLQSYVLTDSGKNEPHILNAGNAGNAIAISKLGNVKTEEDLRRVLQILNDMNDGTCYDIMTRGWEGVTYELDEDGYVHLWDLTKEEEAAKLAAAGVTSTDYRDGFNQILLMFTAEANASPLSDPPNTSAIRKLDDKLQCRTDSTNLAYIVMNEGSGYSSEYYKMYGSDLDKIISEAQQKYITGQIERNAMEAAIKQWWTAGGETVTTEMNAVYHAAGN